MAWMVITSISPGPELLTSPPHWIPEEPTLERYESIFSTAGVDFRGVTVNSPASTFLHGLLNSLIVASATMLICLVMGLLAAFAFARLRFQGKGSLFIGIMALQMLPAIATVIPLFALFQRLGFTDHLFVLISIYSGFSVTYIIWVMTGYIRGIPVDLEEAARIDGCSQFGAFLRVTLPIAVPGIVAAGTLSFLTAWNEFLFALVFGFTEASKTMPVVISEFSTRFGLDYGMMMTGGVIASVPPVLLALLFQRYLVQGLSSGAVKG